MAPDAVPRPQLLPTQHVSVPKPAAAANPFYVVLILVGIAFVVTTFAYALFAFGAFRGETALRHAGDAPAGAEALPPDPQSRQHPLWRILSRHGDTIILVELGLVITLALAAMATDSFWQRRHRRE